MKNVVIGTAMGYGVPQIKNFVMSFRKFNVVDDIILVYDLNQSSRIQKFCQDYNVKLVSFEPHNQFAAHVVSSRFLKYLDILADNQQYKHTLLADIRDVFFQSNPFANLPEDDYLFAFTEDPAITIDIEKYHISMVTRLFGKKVLNDFAGKKIICSGTILGTNKKLSEWLNSFKNMLMFIQKSNPQICYEMLLDQVIANYIFYFDDTITGTVIKNNGDIVGTIGHCITHPNHLGSLKMEYDVIYLDNKAPSIIHQYDRATNLFNHFSEIYSYVD
jgi:hypothetical protein